MDTSPVANYLQPPVADDSLASIIIPTHQRRAALRRALESLARQTDSGAYEVLVSVDGSTDGTIEMLEGLEVSYELSAVVGPHRGRASALNAALREARGEFVLLLDDDMEATPDLVARHRRHHAPGSMLCVLGAVPVELREHHPRAAAYVQAKFAAHLERLGEPGHVFTTRDFYSGNTSLRTEALREVGAFDESFTVYGNEDVELALRLRAAGITLRFDPEAIARQEYDKRLASLARDTLAKGTTTVLLARKHPDAFDDLRLAAPAESSRPWLAARALLLSATRRQEKTASAAIAFAALLERLGLWRQPLFYRAVLDYAFWAGVDSELRRTSDEGALALLGVELRRGPIDRLRRA